MKTGVWYIYKITRFRYIKKISNSSRDICILRLKFSKTFNSVQIQYAIIVREFIRDSAILCI